MTVEIQTRSVVHIGNDIADEFSFEFQLLDEEFLEVYLRNNATEVETLLEDSVYSVTFDDDGGTVTYPLSGSPISASYSIIIKRTVPYLQETEISNQGGFQPAVVEEQLDRIVMQIQQLAEDVVRAVKMKTGTAGVQFPSAEAEKYLGWNAAGTRLENKALAALGDVEVSDDDTLAATGELVVPQVLAVKTHLENNYQPLSADLTSIADAGTTAFGLAFLLLANAAAGRTALELGAVATRAVATFGEYNSATASRALGNDSVWADLTVLTDGATIAVDFNNGYDFGGASNAALALGGDRTLGAPSNVRNGKKGILWFTASGSTRTLTLNAAWVLATGVETGPYSITTSQTLGVAYVCRGTNVVVTNIVRIG